MANDNNNINELVVADDDPTVELEAPAFAMDDAGGAEADAKTFDTQDANDADLTSGMSVSELKSDLRYRAKTNTRLQYDIQQLHAKWLGLEAEISAREAQTSQLNAENSSLNDAVSRKDSLIKKRDQKIKAFKAEIRQRDDEFRQLRRRCDEVQESLEDVLADTEESAAASTTDDSEHQDSGSRQRLDRMESYADSMRQQSQDLIKSNSQHEREIENLSQSLHDAERQNSYLEAELSAMADTVETLRSSLDNIQRQHDEEIRLLRFDLGEAQDTVVENEVLTSQLASDLVDAHGFKEELERMLNDVEQQSSERIAELKKQVNKLTRTSDSYEQKLTSKSEAISVLLAELARKSEQVESIGEIEEVIHDIDERISERSARKSNDEPRAAVDRVTRVLIGTVDGQTLRFPLFKDRLTIGRTKDNDIQLKATYISRRHAVIQTDGDNTRIIDWGSKNGISVNSNRVSEHFLSHGDSLMIGNARFRYEERKKKPHT